MKKQNRMEKLVRKTLIVGVAIFLIGTLIPLVGTAVEVGNVENQEKYLGAENTRIELYKEEGNVKSSLTQATLSNISDTTPPEITDIQCNPLNLTRGWVNITANVTDDTAVNTVKLNITHPELGTVNITMINTLGTNTYYSSSTLIASGTYTYFIWANDTSNNQNITNPYTFFIPEECNWSLTKGNAIANENITDNTTSEPPPINSSGAYGYIGYADQDGYWQSLKYARVELWDDGSWWALTTSHTDANGYYELWASGGDWDGSAYDIRVKFFADDGKIWVTEDWGTVPYGAETPTYYNVEGWKWMGILYLTPESHRIAAHIYSTMMVEQKWFKTQTGYERGDIKVEYPDDTSSQSGFRWSAGGICWIEIRTTDGWNTDVSQHEYGHAILHGMYDGASGETNANHALAIETDQYTALMEGWAEFIECAVDNDARYRGVADLEYNWKLAGPYNPAYPDDKFDDSSDGPGNDDYAAIEGNIAGIFWDIFDTSTSVDYYYPSYNAYDDDGLAMGINEIYDVLRNYAPGWINYQYYSRCWNIHDFWNGWFERGHGNTHWMKAIYYTHGIDKNNAPTCTVTNLGTGWYKGMIAISAAASDTDSEDTSYLQVEFQYSTDRVTWIAIGTDTSSPYSVNWNTGTLSDDSVWVRVRAFDGMEYSSWDECDSSFKVDNTDPTVTDYQSGDDTWRNSNNGYYNVDFYDSGGSMLSYFQTKVATSPNQGGIVRQDWTTVVSGINSNSYTTNWQLLASTWNAMREGTNYVSVRVYDNAGNTVTVDDVFYVKKDTAVPTITDSQVGDDTWRTSAGTTYNVDFSDSTSLLNYAQYKICSSTGQSGTVLKDWINIFSNYNQNSYTTDWGIDFSACQQGTNYVSVRVYDNAGNPVTVDDVFYVKKDTAVPTITDSQVGDDTWRNTNNGYYDIDFSDSGMLSYFQTKVTTSTNQGGTVLQGWTTVVNGINSNSYTTNWQLLSSTWSAMQQGTNYVSVRVYDCAGFSVTVNDVFYVKKDTTLPSITDYQAGDDTWRNSAGTTYNVDFSDSTSLLNYAQYKITTVSNEGGTVLKDWTNIFSNLNSASYTTNWQIDFSACQEGTNYVSVRVYDYAGNPVTVDDVFYVKKDTVAPTITLGTPPIVENSEYLHSHFIYGDPFLCNILFYSDLMGIDPQSFTIQGTATDTQSGLNYAASTSAFGDTPNENSNPTTWSFTYTVVESDTGNDYIYVTVYDNVNNQATEKFYYHEDTQGPDTPVLNAYYYAPDDEFYDGAVITNRRPTFYWYDTYDSGYINSGLGCYKLQVDDDSGFTSPYEVLVSGTSYTPCSDFDFTTYYWNVSAKDNVGNWGGWSSVWSFTVERMYGVDLYPEDQKAGANPGTDVTFTITINNTGNDYDIIDLVTTEGYLSNDYVSLQYWEEPATVTLTLHMPEDAGDICVVAAMVTGTSRNDTAKYNAVSCSIGYISDGGGDGGGVKRILPIQPDGVLPGDIIDGVDIGIDGHVAFPGTVLDGDLDRLPGGRDGFCINSIIGIIHDFIIIPDLDGLPGFFPRHWYCDADNIYQLYYVNVSNPFNSTIIVNLSVYGVPDGWDAYLSNYSISLEPGEYVIITLTVVIPRTTTIGQTTIWVLGTIQDYDYLFMYGINVTVGELPVAIARVESSYTVILENDVLIFNGSYSYDPDGAIFSYEWDFGDGTNGTGMAVEHSYENTGNYVVTLTVRDNYNLTNSTIICVSVEHHSFEVSVQQITTGVRPGETAVYMVNIENTGTISDTYMLRMINLDSSWDYPDNMYVGVSAGGSITLYLKVTVSSDFPIIYNTTYNFTITVTCMHDEMMMSNAPLSHSINENLTVIATKESKTRYMINEVEELITTLDGMDIPKGIKNSLRCKLEGALEKLNTALDDILNGDEKHANNMLNCAQNKINAFINEVEAQRGKKISNDDADVLSDAGQTLISHIDETMTTLL